MTKRISQIQLQGIEGEKAFEHWASRNGLLATKLDPDQGIDYVCQLVGDRTDKTDKSSYYTPGKMLAVAVRSSDKVEPKVRINRDDARLLLQINMPTAIAILDLRTTSEPPKVYFRFMDNQFLAELFNFLKGSKQSYTIKATSCISDPYEIRSAVEGLFNPGAWEKIESLKREMKLQQIVPGARLTVVITAGSVFSIVHVPEYSDQYRGERLEVKEKIEAVIFGRQELLKERMENLQPRNGLLAALEGTPSPIIIGMAKWSEFGSVEIKACREQEEAICRFEMKKSGIWIAFCHRSGLSLKVSEAVEKDGQLVHLTEDHIDAATQLSDLQDRELSKFLLCCREGGHLEFASGLLLSASQFRNLNALGWLCDYLERLQHVSWLAVEGWRASDVTEEDLQSLRFLSKIEERRNILDGFGFILGGFELSAVRNHPTHFKLPICMNLRGKGFVCWLRADGMLFIEPEQNRCVGLRVTTVKEALVKETGKSYPTNGFPKMKVFSGWPAIAVFQTEQALTWTGDDDWGVEIEFL